MKDTLDMVTDIRSLINVPEIIALIDGQIYPDVRPDNSSFTDIVVNSTGLTNTQNQIGYGNVNIYKPNIIRNINDKNVSFPDHSGLKSLSNITCPYLDTQYRDTFRTQISGTPEMMQDKDGSWFVNIKVKYYSLQTNFKNL